MTDHEHGHEHGHHAPAPAAHDFKVAEHVLADFGGQVDGVTGFIVAHIAKDAYDVNGETKYGIQAPNGSVHAMAYRETKPGDVTGLTFKRIPA